MALSQSLWRTFATDYPVNPERALAETNRRIMEDTHGGLYITLFYGVLNPQNGDFTYCSAGHHPALLLRAKNGALEQLESTGMPLGVLEETSWNRMKVNIKKGDALVLYTDGITDAQNTAEEFFSLERLQRALKRQVGKNAIELRNALLGEVHNWVGNAPQFDDITLMVVVREK
jgi:sigma-B regulation protein RsbU (phosphoserine phosphatase)